MIDDALERVHRDTICPGHAGHGAQCIPATAQVLELTLCRAGDGNRLRPRRLFGGLPEPRDRCDGPAQKGPRLAVTVTPSESSIHDFRRTAVRHLEHAGVPRSVAMKMTDHKSESVNACPTRCPRPDSNRQAPKGGGF